MLGALLGIGEQRFAALDILGTGAAGRAGGGDRTDRDLFVADADQNFGRRSDQREAGQVEEIEEGRWVDAPQRAVEVEGRQVEGGRETLRSEEHTSELQSLMRSSYAVFCLKTKNNNTVTNNQNNTGSNRK